MRLQVDKILMPGTFGLFANFQIIRFYFNKWKKLIPLLYLALGVTDFVVSLTAQLHFIAMILMLYGKLF